MKAKYWTVWLAGWFFLLANPAWAEMAGETTKSYIGVRLNQVPDVLRKHLKLDDNRGLLIQNIQLGSPADKAGLEKDDIIISWNGQPVTSYQEFVDQVQQAGVGTEITLDVIHNGDVKTIPVTLEPYQKLDSWKYPAGPEGFGRLQPGRVFRLQPDKQNWEQIPFGQVPEMKDYFKRFFQQKHSYKSADGEMNLEITIEGDPHDPNAKIKIEDRKERTHYETAADQIDQLPEKYRQPVRQVLEEAQKSEFDYDFDWPQWRENYEDPFNRQNWPPEWLRNRSDESMSNQMQDLMERMGQLEKNQQELLERMERFEKK
jgi:hypothetical protein